MKEFGAAACSIEEFQSSISYKEYLVRLAWIREKNKHPDATQHYLMQIACEVANVLRKERIPLDAFKLEFKPEKRKEEKDEQKREHSKSMWGGILKAMKAVVSKRKYRIQDGQVEWVEEEEDSED